MKSKLSAWTVNWPHTQIEHTNKNLSGISKNNFGIFWLDAMQGIETCD